MKTIKTTLPIYNKIQKQCFERGKKAGFDTPVPIICPRHRLPSFQWKDEADGAVNIRKIELIDKTYNGSEVDVATTWLNHVGFDVFTHTLLTIASAQNAAGICSATTDGFATVRGTQIRFRGTLVRNSAAGTEPFIFLGGPFPSTAHLSVGVNDIILSSDLANIGNGLSVYRNGVTDYELSAVSVKKITGALDITDYFNITPSYIQGWNNNAYDTFTSTAYITSAIKTTAAGEASANNVISAGSVPTAIAIGDIIRIRANLILNSGTAPKIVLRNTGTGAVISNIVTLANGINYIQLRATAALASGWAIYMYNSNTEVTNYSCQFANGEKSIIPSSHALGADVYFQYKGGVMGYLLPEGEYYLKITTDNGYVYYSDWFKITCVYEQLITGWINNGYDTLTTDDTEIQSAIDAAGTVSCYSDGIGPVIKDQDIVVKFFMTNVNELPDVILYSSSLGSLDIVASVTGLNEIILTSTVAVDDCVIMFQNDNPAQWSATDMYVMMDYSTKYLVINFSNTCDLGDILYQGGFIQTLWIESETMEPSYPVEEEGQKNSEAKYFRTFARQVKKYLVRTKEIPEFLVEVFHRMKLHDTVELIDLVGDENDVYNLEVEHEWLYEDRYYAKAELTFDYDEAIIVDSCCEDMT